MEVAVMSFSRLLGFLIAFALLALLVQTAFSVPEWQGKTRAGMRAGDRHPRSCLSEIQRRGLSVMERRFLAGAMTKARRAAGFSPHDHALARGLCATSSGTWFGFLA